MNNDQRVYTRTAMSTKKINVNARIMRGGTRLQKGKEMKKYVKNILYYASILCPIADIFKGIIRGIYSTLEEAQNEYNELKEIDHETVINHNSVLKEKK